MSSEEDEQLDVVAAYHAQSSSATLRRLVKREHDRIRAAERALDGLEERDIVVIAALGKLPTDKQKLSFELMFLGCKARETRQWVDAHLEKLCRLAYIEDTPDGYLLLAKGRAAREGLLDRPPRALRRLIVERREAE